MYRSELKAFKVVLRFVRWIRVYCAIIVFLELAVFWGVCKVVLGFLEFLLEFVTWFSELS